jgi:hypothetical protein
MRYAAKKDWWVRLLVLPPTLAALAAGLALLLGTPGPAGAPLLVPGLLLAGVGLLLLWLYAATSYEITGTHVVARLGPYRRRIPLDRIAEVTSTRRFHLVLGLGLAWSLDMLHIRCRRADGRLDWPVSIAPRDKEGFLRELTTAVPGLTVVYRDGPAPDPR